MYEIPLSGSAEYVGTVGSGADRDERGFSGQVVIETPPGLPDIELTDRWTWAGPGTGATDTGNVSWDLPSLLPRGISLKVAGFHHDDPERCEGPAWRAGRRLVAAPIGPMLRAPGDAGHTLPVMTERSHWTKMIEEDPEHSQRYIERFRAMAADGIDLGGEARLIDAMVPRGARILDAGCGPGRVGAILFDRGHHVVGVDVDPALIAAANTDHPGPTWLVGDLAEMDLVADGIAQPFDVIVSAGNVLAFLAASTRRPVLERLRSHLTEQGRIVIGLGAGRDYDFDDCFADIAASGLSVDLRASTWDLRPFANDSGFLVAVLSRA